MTFRGTAVAERPVPRREIRVATQQLAYPGTGLVEGAAVGIGRRERERLAQGVPDSVHFASFARRDREGQPRLDRQRGGQIAAAAIGPRVR